MLKCYFGHVGGDKIHIKVNFNCFFSLFKMWLLENVKLHVSRNLFFRTTLF